MVVKFQNNIQFQMKNSNFLDLETQEKVQQNWEEFVKDKDGYFNGDIFVIHKQDIENGLFEVVKAKYADLIYARTHPEITVYSLFSSILFMTKDHYYVFILNHHDRVNVVGGLASREDFIDDIFQPKNCLAREIQEEIGFDLYNKEQILEYHMNYLAIPDEGVTVSPFGVVFTGILNYTKEELIQYYLNNKSHFDSEIKELLFYTEDNYLELDQYDNKEPYLMDLMNEIVKRK